MKRPPKRRIIVTIEVEMGNSLKKIAAGTLKPNGPYGGDYQASELLAYRLTATMANELAAKIKRDVMRRGFRPLLGYRTIR